MDFAATLAELLALLGRRVTVEVRVRGFEVATIRGTLAAGDDLGDFERAHGVGGPEHDRLLFTMREHPYPEGFYLDRRTFEASNWDRGLIDPELRLQLRGGVVVAVIEDTRSA